MGGLNLRVRGPNGTATLTGVPEDETVAAFQERVAERCGVPASSQRFKAGFPPKSLPITDSGIGVRAWGLSNGESLVLEAAKAAATAAPVASAPHAPTDPAAMTEDEQIAMAMAASMQDAAPSAAPAAAAPPAPRATRAVSNAPPGHSVAHPLPDGRRAVRRVVDSDNSCLFNAVGYCMERSRRVAPRLRRLIAETVAQDPFTFNEGMLGRGNEEYQAWIQSPDKWGGPIELFILAKHFRKQIAAYDIRTCRCDTYGGEDAYGERCYLLYDGLHYDALAVEARPGAPESADCTAVRVDSPDLPQVEAAMEALVQSLQASKKFTDTANFTLRCGVCNRGLKGEKEAVEHAKSTGHQNFQEY